MRKSISCIAAAVVLASPAAAAEVSYIGSSTELFDPSLTLTGFDSSLGTLTSAELTYDLEYMNALSFYKVCETGGGCDESWTFTATADVNAFGGTLDSGSGSETFTCVARPGEECFDAKPLTVNVAGSMTLDILDVLDVPNFLVSAFTPAPTVPGGIPDFFDVFPEATLIASVTYTFDDGSVPPIPLPASAWLLMAGLGGLGLARKRKA